MSLTGALEAFPLPEVLRLLARSGKSGTLRVDAAELQGRIYLADGALTYATTRRNVSIYRLLMSRIITSQFLLAMDKLS